MRIICHLLGDDAKPPVPVEEHDDGRVTFIADADICADGAPFAYNPQNGGLDSLQNASDGRGNWVGIATDEFGDPYIQTHNDPAPGYYVSTTALQWKHFARSDPRRYIDAEMIPYVVVSSRIIKAVRGVVLGCRARITNTRNGRCIEAVVADVGPARKAGELSIAAARLLSIPFSARSGGEDENVILYELWPGECAVVGGVVYPLQPS